MTSANNISVIPVRSARQLKQFIRLPWSLYKNDPAWVPPLLMEEKKRFDRLKNPFFQHAEAEYFLAFQNGTPVGRISAHIDFLHNETHKEKTGFFGLFESPDEAQVAHALLDQAAAWLCEGGMKRVRGPLSFSINDEAGLLVDGFEHPPYIMTPHNPVYYPQLIEAWGLEKAKDLYCWRYDQTRPIPKMALEIAEEVRKYPGLKIRGVDPKNLEHDVGILIDVFNSAWSRNWGFVPLTEAEIKKAAQDFQQILEPKIALIAELDGKPIAISLAIPNINEIISDLNGRLFPFGVFKLLARIKRKKFRSIRLILLGIKKEYRGSILGGLSVLFYTEVHRHSQALGHQRAELSWTLEDNEKINQGIQMMGGEHYKTYRVYEKGL